MFWKRAFDLGIDRSMCKKVPLVQIIIPLMWTMAMQRGILCIYILLISHSPSVPVMRGTNNIQTQIYIEQKKLREHYSV